MSVPQIHSSVPILLLQLCALPPASKGFLGSSAQSPPKLFVYMNVVPSSVVILLPVFPVVELGDGELPESAPDVDTEELLFLFLVRITGTVMLTTITARTAREIRMMFLFLRDGGVLENVRLVLCDEVFTGIGGSYAYYQK